MRSGSAVYGGLRACGYPHAFRRTYACESVRNGMNLFYVQSLLGHSTLTMTRIYAEQVNSEDAIKAYKPVVI
jgi:integrase